MHQLHDEVVGTSIVARTSVDGPNGMCFHVIVVLLMSLDILTKFYFAMILVVELASEDNFKWALSLGNSMF